MHDTKNGIEIFGYAEFPVWTFGSRIVRFTRPSINGFAARARHPSNSPGITQFLGREE
jgi:hypothetical protein